MTAVIAIPELACLVSEQQAKRMLMRPVAGVPLLMRTVLRQSGSLDLSGRSKRQPSTAIHCRTHAAWPAGNHPPNRPRQLS
jgi:hypothetical protein